jgi:hypothetical protein
VSPVTERALPAVSVGPRPVARDGIAPRPAAVARPTAAGATRPTTRPAVAKKEAILTTPARAGMLFGVSAAVYAVTLAGVAGFQAQTDAATAAARQPYLDTVARARAANDALESQVQAAQARVLSITADYNAIGSSVTDNQARLNSLASLVAEVEGTAAALPAQITLPNVSMAGAVAGGSRSSGGAAPKAVAKTGASGKP